MQSRWQWAAAWVALLYMPAAAALKPATPREVILLDGVWQIAEGDMDQRPGVFDHNVAVPGLADMAEPAFEDVGKTSDKRQAFWYRRTFTLGRPVPDTAILKIAKAKYGTKVWLNGKVVGDYWACFTPAYLDVRGTLKGGGQENELIVRVGAHREIMPEGHPTGWDFEKYKYIPGIYDSVELILTGPEYISNVQIVPDIESEQVRIAAEIANPTERKKIDVECILREAATGRQVHAGQTAFTPGRHEQSRRFDQTICIPDCRLWSPEDPFLYELEIRTSSDAAKTRFGMRSFRFDPKTGRAILNGRPYFMRGTNVCIYRFFEDDLRADRPWRGEWVRRLHETFKGMHWNSIRYCIGFPPEEWYDIADEVGFLIQDEFPVWLLSDAPEDPQAKIMIPEYIAWMRERWNHACVVIWDAQNESITPETAKVIEAVRSLDLSGRPWENGWMPPQAAGDPWEAHPYLFIRDWQNRGRFKMSELATMSGQPPRHPSQTGQFPDAPVVINEYAWLWLNRDGSPTTLTKRVYENMFGRWSTTPQRRQRYARYLAALTEFWRTHRECAGVLHFCGLGYSRSGLLDRPEGGATSDHFVDLERLTFEPHFERYVRDAFAPVGLMADFWKETVQPGSRQAVDLVVINDTYEPFDGTLRVRIRTDADECVNVQSRPCRVEALGRNTVTLMIGMPHQEGEYELIAEIVDDRGEPVRSVREFTVE